MPNRAHLLLLALLVSISLPGCVYYNTFYHARAAAHEASLLREERAPGAKPSQQEMELLDRVAEKCTRVLELHPHSSWADDALLLLGETRYHQQRYESAEEHLTELLTRYPDSELRPRAEFLLASVLIENGNPTRAESILEELAYSGKAGDLADDALALIGQARYARGKYEEAAETFEEALSRSRGSERRAEIRYMAALNYEAMGDLDEAARQLAMVTEEQGARSVALEARMRLAEVDIARGRGEEALDVLGELERRTEDRNELDRVLLLKGKALESLGRYDDAVSNYEGIAASHERSEGSAEAFYRIGLIRRDHDEDLEAASEMFGKAREEAPRSDAAAEATAASRDVQLLTGYLAAIAASERRAELAAEQSEQVNSEDQGAGDGASSEDTGTDATSGGSEPALSDTAGAHGDRQGEPGGESPPQESASQSQEDESPSEGGDAEAEEPEDEIAIATFRAAELYMFRLDDPERALTYYRAVVTEHPQSSLAPKAALATAWIYDKKLGEADRARTAYEAVIDDYPGTDFAEAARESLGGLASGTGDE